MAHRISIPKPDTRLDISKFWDLECKGCQLVLRYYSKGLAIISSGHHACPNPRLQVRDNCGRIIWSDKR